VKWRVRVAFPDGESTEHVLVLGPNEIGRDAALPIPHPSVSAAHAVIDVAPDAVILTDRGSRNGSFDASGQRLSGPHRLEVGSPVTLGACQLTLLAEPTGTQAMPVVSGAPAPEGLQAPATRGPAPPKGVAGSVVAGLTERLPALSPPRRRLLAAGFGAAVLVALLIDLLGGGDPSRGQLEGLLREHYAEASGPECWSWEKLNFRWPIEASNAQVKGPGGGMSPILVGLARGGHVTLEGATRPGSGFGDPFFAMQAGASATQLLQQGRLSVPAARSASSYYLIDLSEKGEEDGVWDDEHKSFCVGRRDVDEVREWTEPSSRADGTVVSRVTYTWTIVERPDWIGDEAFAAYPGMAKPVPAEATFEKTNDGWRLSSVSDAPPPAESPPPAAGANGLLYEPVAGIEPPKRRHASHSELIAKSLSGVAEQKQREREVANQPPKAPLAPGATKPPAVLGVELGMTVEQTLSILGSGAQPFRTNVQYRVIDARGRDRSARAGDAGRYANDLTATRSSGGERDSLTIRFARPPEAPRVLQITRQHSPKPGSTGDQVYVDALLENYGESSGDEWPTRIWQYGPGSVDCNLRRGRGISYQFPTERRLLNGPAEDCATSLIVSLRTKRGTIERAHFHLGNPGAVILNRERFAVHQKELAAAANRVRLEQATTRPRL
jgi:hypothetical protein